MKSALIPIVSLLVLNSCSWYKDLERSLVEDDEKQARRSRTVPREQYDQLLVKYEELSKKYQHLKEGGKESSLADELQKTSGENFAQSATNAETVDVFPAAGTETSSAPVEVPADLESQLELFRKGLALKTSNPGEATKIFQQLESKGVPAVRARSKFQIGELLFSKGQYDLSLQVFEDIIGKESHSGVVLEALKYAAASSEKLGIQNKRDQYSSMLKDVFEAN